MIKGKLRVGDKLTWGEGSKIFEVGDGRKSGASRDEVTLYLDDGGMILPRSQVIKEFSRAKKHATDPA